MIARIKTVAERTLAYQQRKKEYLDAYKITRGCGSPWCDIEIERPEDLEFHHSKPEEKSFAIGKDRNRVGWRRLKIEVEKCEVLCLRCHHTLTASRRSAILRVWNCSLLSLDSARR